MNVVSAAFTTYVQLEKVAETTFVQKNCTFNVDEMGRYQRGVHFGAASLKRGEESSKFPVAIFCPPFFLHYF